MLMVVMVVQYIYALYGIYLNFNMNGISYNNTSMFCTCKCFWYNLDNIIVCLCYVLLKHFNAHTYESDFLFLRLYMSSEWSFSKCRDEVNLFFVLFFFIIHFKCIIHFTVDTKLGRLFRQNCQCWVTT